MVRNQGWQWKTEEWTKKICWSLNGYLIEGFYLIWWALHPKWKLPGKKRQTDWLLDFNGDRQIVELTSNQAESSPWYTTPHSNTHKEDLHTSDKNRRSLIEDFSYVVFLLTFDSMQIMHWRIFQTYRKVLRG